MAQVDYSTWKNGVLGVGLDIDGAYGKQCVDVVLSWAQACFPGIHWPLLFKPVQSAKDLFDAASPQYFDKILNDHNNPNQLPKTGDIAVFAASPEAGYTSTYANPDGTTGVVDHADTQYVYIVHQDGSDPKIVTQLKQRSWRYTRCIGWLRPKFGTAIAPAPNVGDGRIGRTLYIHGIPAKSVVKVGADPIPRNVIGWLLPARFHKGPHGQPGLMYEIVGISQYPNTVTIHTDSYGLVDLLIDKDCEIL